MSRKQSLHLLDKTLPISVATAPQLRSRRQFSFNGLRYEMSGLPPLPPPPPPPQLSRLRAGGGGGGGSQESGSAGGDGQLPKGVLPKRVSQGDRALLMNGGVRMPRRSELDFPREKLEKEKEEEEQSQRRRREKKQRRKELEVPNPPQNPSGSGLTSQQSWLLAQSLLKAYGSGLVEGEVAATSSSKMDYITLAGLVLGCVASHALFLLCWYFSWLKNQAVGLRKRFLGNANLWEFFDMEDTSRYSVQTKLVLAPLILLCGLLYCVVNMLHLVVQVVRSDVPRTVVVFVQRVANSGLLGTITLGLAGNRGGGGGGGAVRGRQKQAIR
ncbi:uncharacterized protein [Drosophila takahashii]|uniref:uncharacterized protein n=1 Tax=Drosophila takahashii TaxID=29030 RepID=UPI001CF8D71B|nr:uncharacterized protein LOC108054714 [Drosophila takahashii]